MLFLVFVILFSGFDRDLKKKLETVVVSVEDEKNWISMRKKAEYSKVNS